MRLLKVSVCMRFVRLVEYKYRSCEWRQVSYEVCLMSFKVSLVVGRCLRRYKCPMQLRDTGDVSKLDPSLAGPALHVNGIKERATVHPLAYACATLYT